VKWLVVMMLLIAVSWPVAAQEDAPPDYEAVATSVEEVLEPLAVEDPSVSSAVVNPDAAPTNEPTNTPSTVVPPTPAATVMATSTPLPPTLTGTRTPTTTRTTPSSTATREIPSTAYRIRVTYLRTDEYRDEVAGAHIYTAKCGVKDRYSVAGYVDGNKTLLVWLSDGQSCRIDRITGALPGEGSR